MTEELVSKRTRIAFREFMVVDLTLREIDDEFQAAHIECSDEPPPNVSGQRRTLVEQYYQTLDCSKPSDARRLLDVFTSVLLRAERTLHATMGLGFGARRTSFEDLVTALKRDGFAYEGGRITAATESARRVFETAQPEQTISEVTRRAIFDELSVRGTNWSGRLEESAFLGRLWDLRTLPSYDGRYKDMMGDVCQHREWNRDWSDEWVFADARLDLLGCPDQKLLDFLCLVVNPVVRDDPEEMRALVSTFNEHLAADGWELVPVRNISNRPVHEGRRRSSSGVVFPEPLHASDVLSSEYVLELPGKCDARLASGDLDGAVTVARTLLEAILGELELRLAGSRGDHKGELAKQFKVVTKLLRMDEQRPDLDERFKDVIRGLVTVASGLAPLRNKISDGHARVRRPAPHHARLVVNAAKTVSSFLVESYRFQVDRGLLGSVLVASAPGVPKEQR